VRAAPFAGDGTSGIFAWGGQTEAGSFATSYIPTVASQVTRAADNASMLGDNFATWYRQDQGTLYVNADTLNLGATRRNVQVDDGTSNERLYIGTDTTRPTLVAVDGGATQAAIAVSGTTFTVNTPYKIAGAYALNDFAVCGNGGTVGTDTSGTLPTVTLLRLGSTETGVNGLNGHILAVNYYPVRLPDATLQSITS
jgi:hypothetical protein